MVAGTDVLVDAVVVIGNNTTAGSMMICDII